MTRRDILKSGLGISGILAARKAPAVIVRGLLGANGAKYVSSGGLENPYVTDGLVAMWDGEWNVGYGKHDDATAAWKDLVGVNNGTLFGSLSWSSNSLNYSGGYVSLPNNLGITLGCVECCFYAPTSLSSFFLFEVHGSNAAILIGKYGNNKRFLTSVKSVGISINTVGDYGSMCVSRSFIYYNGENVTSNLNDYFGLGSYSTLGCRANKSYKLTGAIYCVRIYDRALAPDEIAHNYSVDAERFGI